MLRKPVSHPVARLIAASWLLAFALACEEDGLRPALPAPAPAPITFYPLGAGSAWTYISTRHVSFLAPDGSDRRPPIDQQAMTTREIVATEVIRGVTWSVEEERFFFEGGLDTAVTWRRWREDANGLYRADLSTSIPPGGVPDTLILDAARRFAYPREVGAVWHLRDRDPLVTGTLAAIDEVATEIGERSAFVVEYRFPGDGPSDHRRFWYSGCGILRSEIHAEIDAIDAISGELVLIVSDQNSAIVAVHPPCPGRPATRP